MAKEQLVKILDTYFNERMSPSRDLHATDKAVKAIDALYSQPQKERIKPYKFGYGETQKVVCPKPEKHICYSCIQLGDCVHEAIEDRSQSEKMGLKFSSKYADADVIFCPDYQAKPVPESLASTEMLPKFTENDFIIRLCTIINQLQITISRHIEYSPRRKAELIVEDAKDFGWKSPEDCLKCQSIIAKKYEDELTELRERVEAWENLEASIVPEELGFDEYIQQLKDSRADERQKAFKEVEDTFRKWLVSQISDEELCKVLNISSYDCKILFQEKKAGWNSYIGSLVQGCQYPLCKVRQELSDQLPSEE